MAGPRDNSFTFDFEGAKYTAVLDESAIATFEDATDRSIFEVAGVNGRLPKLTLLGSLLCALLERHHGTIERETGMRMLRTPNIGEMMQGSLASAMPRPDDDDEPAQGAGSSGNPPKSGGRKGGKTG